MCSELGGLNVAAVWWCCWWWWWAAAAKKILLLLYKDSKLFQALVTDLQQYPRWLFMLSSGVVLLLFGNFVLCFLLRLWVSQRHANLQHTQFELFYWSSSIFNSGWWWWSKSFWDLQIWRRICIAAREQRPSHTITMIFFLCK